jgi:long-chain acyl-CoA synthetase
MRQASESVSPKVRQAFDTMQDKIKKQSEENDGESSMPVGPSETEKTTMIEER